MRKRYAKSPKRDLVHSRVINMVRAVQSDDGAESRPGAERASAEGCDARGRGAGVDLLRAGQGEVGLDAVAEGDDGDLWFCVRTWIACRELQSVRRGATWAGNPLRLGGRM